jgi:predicted nucleotide-binding protein (sugar kinase/HSP70/actin superfamily)
MAPIQFRLLEQVLRDAGFLVRIVPEVTKAMVDWALSNVHNDMCYPALLSIGQVCYAALSGEYGDPDSVAIVMTQTGGGCRASQYVGFIKKALADNGHPDIPVIPLAFAPIKGEKWNQLGFKVRDVRRAMYAFLLGDLVMVLANKVRPYEKVAGHVNGLTESILSALTDDGFVSMNDENFAEWVRYIVREYSKVCTGKAIGSRPKIGVVGEILLKYHPDGNNHLVEMIEAQECEAVVSPLIDFFLYCLSGPVFQSGVLGRSKLKAWPTKKIIEYVEKRKEIVNKVLAVSEKFAGMEWPTIWELSDKVHGIIPIESSMGEGWLLPAEIVDLIENDCPYVVIAQPFACLPNHQIGAGTTKAISERYPEAEIISINYDPGVSATNQENRISLLVGNAWEYHRKNFNNKEANE